MANLKPPGNKSDISTVGSHVLMRLRVQGRPAVGLLTPTMGGRRLLLYVDEGGNLLTVQVGLYGLKIEFIDYLLENEFISIFGTSSERSDEADLGPDPSTLRPISIPCRGAQDFSGIPDWTPFCVDNSHRGPMWVVMAPSAERANERIALYVGRNSKTSMGYRFESQMAHSRDVFEAMADLEELKRFGMHPDLTATAGHPF